MGQHQELLDTLKKELRAQHITYAHVARSLGMSEANIKRIFSEKKVGLDRVEAICRLVDMDIVDLVKRYQQTKNCITYLTREQEKEVISDPGLLVVAVCVRNHYRFDDIINSYNISESECIKHLAKLDRLKLIELLPGNRIRLLINEDFHWIPNGPIEKFFQKNMQPEFLNTDFSKNDEFRIFLNGEFSDGSHELLMRKLRQVANEFMEQHRQCLYQPHDKKRSESLLIAFRPWEYSIFRDMTRK